MALFTLLHSLQKKWKFRLGLLHVNHQLRGRESLRDEAFVRGLAKKLGVPFYSGKVHVKKLAREKGWSLEEAARKLRYDFFAKQAARHRIPVIALAHTQDDQAETILMRMLTGTGLRGLAGIRSERCFGKARLIRPLLGFSKKEVMAFLKEHKIRFVKDSSNDSSRFIRNRIRSRLIPWIEKEINPKAVQALARIPVILQEEVLWLDQLEDMAWKKALRSKTSKQLRLNRTFFLGCLPALQFRILDRALKALDPASGINFLLWQKLKQELNRRNYQISLPRDIDFILKADSLVLLKRRSK